MPSKKTSYRVSLGGIIASLSLLLMFSTAVFPPFSIAAPMFTGILISIIGVEVDHRWALVTYAAVALLCIFVTPCFEANFMFILFFGYYPILKWIYEKIKPFLLRWIAKLLTFNISMGLWYIIIRDVLGVYDMWADFVSFGKYLVPFILGFINLMFILYDYTVGTTLKVYVKWFKPTYLPSSKRLSKKA